MSQLTIQKQYFDKEYSRLTGYHLGPWQEQYLKRMDEYLLKGVSKNRKLLDIAAGSGYVSVEMAKKGHKVYAIEASKVSLKNLRTYRKTFSLNNFDIRYSKAEQLPFASSSMDYIVANAVLEHIPNEKAAIKEWIRVLKKGGRIFITVPLKFRYLWPFLWLLNYIHDMRIGHLRRYDARDLEYKFGLKSVKIFYTGHLVKVVGYFINLVLKSRNFEKVLEKIDSKFENKRYGSSNVTVIFEK